ncbi:MAG TPA: alanyl-tRNA editing protein [Anaeromyxobacteraceae bacterium]|nr:alanyl-tRNA editing protein [Anaeromyxobacteraceae bacterium]
MTVRLYLTDADLLDFEANVLATRSLGDRPAVVLDRTAFYPEGGGQPADRGLLGGVPVVDVQEVEGEILHALGGPAPSGAVHGAVDRERRRDHLQQHHGQHLLSAAFEALLGARTVSFHLGAETSTIDLDAPAARLDAAALRAAEGRANELVFRDLPVEARDYEPEELAELPLRKEAVKGSRVVVVGSAAQGGIVDASPCGGTHPRRTGEVGAVAVLRAQRWGAGTRVEFVWGARTVRLLAEANERLLRAAEALRCAAAEVATAAARTAEDLAARRKEAERLAAALADGEAARLAEGGAAVVRAVLVPPGGGAAAWLRGVGSGLAARGRTALLGAVEEGRAYLCFARPKGPGASMGDLLREAVAVVGGKGGGAPDLAQGSGPEAGKLEAALDAAAARL